MFDLRSLFSFFLSALNQISRKKDCPGYDSEKNKRYEAEKRLLDFIQHTAIYSVPNTYQNMAQGLFNVEPVYWDIA